MLRSMHSFPCHLDLVRNLFVRSCKNNPAEISSGMKNLRSNHIMESQRISDKIIGCKLLLRDLDKITLHRGTDRHITPCIFGNDYILPHRLIRAFKLLFVLGQRKEEAFLLLDSHKELLHCLLSKRPFPHIIIERHHPWIFIPQDLIKTHGTEQPARFQEILHRQEFKILHVLHLSMGCHKIRALNHCCKGKLIFTSVTNHGKCSVFHVSGLQPFCIVGE